MPNFLPLPLFADAGAVVGLLVLIFTVVGWLVNLANSQTNPPPQQRQPQRPPRPQRERVQNEIDIFLREVRGEAPAKGKEDADIVIESLPPEPTRRQSVVTPPSAPPASLEPQSQRGRLGQVMPHVESHVGQTLASHHLESQVGVRAPQPAPAALDPRALGEAVALQPAGTAARPTPLPIASLIKSRQGMRQAILVNEILSKPKALREE